MLLELLFANRAYSLHCDLVQAYVNPIVRFDFKLWLIVWQSDEFRNLCDVFIFEMELESRHFETDWRLNCDLRASDCHFLRVCNVIEIFRHSWFSQRTRDNLARAHYLKCECRCMVRDQAWIVLKAHWVSNSYLFTDVIIFGLRVCVSNLKLGINRITHAGDNRQIFGCSWVKDDLFLATDAFSVSAEGVYWVSERVKLRYLGQIDSIGGACYEEVLRCNCGWTTLVFKVDLEADLTRLSRVWVVHCPNKVVVEIAMQSLPLCHIAWIMRQDQVGRWDGKHCGHLGHHVLVIISPEDGHRVYELASNRSDW